MPILGCLAAIIIFIIVAAIISVFASVAWFLIEFIALPLLVVLLIVWLITSLTGGGHHQDRSGSDDDNPGWRDDGDYSQGPRREVHNLNDDDDEPKQ